MTIELSGEKYQYWCKPLAMGGSTSQLYEVMAVKSEPEKEYPPLSPDGIVIKLAGSKAKHEKFLLEKKILDNLRDTSRVPKIYDWQLTTEPYFLVMEFFVDLQPLKPKLSEHEAIKWAIQYSQLLQKLHQLGYANSDRQLPDIGLVDNGEGGKRLVVVDWGGVVRITPENIKFDIQLVARFWYELMLGTSPSSSSSPQNHRRWSELSFGVQQILTKGLQKEYVSIETMLQDWQKIDRLWAQQDVAQFEREFKQASKPVEALTYLDMIRLLEPDYWQENNYNGEADRLKVKLDERNELVEQIAKEINRGRYAENDTLKNVFSKGTRYSGKPEWRLRAHRWKILADFGQWALDSSTEVHDVFSTALRQNWIEAIKQLEAENWEGTLNKFWQPLATLPELPLLGRNTIEQTKKLVQQGEIGQAQTKIAELIGDDELDPVTKQLLKNIFSNSSHCLAWSIEATLRKELDKSENNLEKAVDNLTSQNLNLPPIEQLIQNIDHLDCLRQNLQGFTLNQGVNYWQLLEASNLVWPQDSYCKLKELLDKWQANRDKLDRVKNLGNLDEIEQAYDTLKKVYKDFQRTRFDTVKSTSEYSIDLIIEKMISWVEQWLDNLEKANQIPTVSPNNLAEAIWQLNRLKTLDKSLLKKYPFLGTQFSTTLEQITTFLQGEQKMLLFPVIFRKVQDELKSIPQTEGYGNDPR